jgi:membrane protein involved in colicin uptake
LWSMPEESLPFRLMTYRQLAGLWAVSVEAAQERVRRARWPKRPGNGRAVLVEVPLSQLERATPESAPDVPALMTPVREQREREVEVLRAEVAQLRAVLERARDEITAQRESRLLAEGEVAGLRTAVQVAEGARERAEAALLAEREARRALEVQSVDDARALAQAESDITVTAAEREAALIARDVAQRGQAEAAAEAAEAVGRAAQQAQEAARKASQALLGLLGSRGGPTTGRGSGGRPGGCTRRVVVAASNGQGLGLVSG